VRVVSMYDTSKEEEWERMINPHNFEGGRGRSGYRYHQRHSGGSGIDPFELPFLQIQFRFRTFNKNTIDSKLLFEVSGVGSGSEMT